MKKVINRGKRSKTLSEVKLVENISKNLQSFLEVSPMEKEVLLSHKLQDHAYEQYEHISLFALTEDNLSERNCWNQLSNPSLSDIELECQEHLIQGKIHIQRNWNKGLLSFRKFVKLSFRELCGSKLSGLHPSDNMAIIH